MAAAMTRAEQYLENEDPFRRNAFLIIEKMVELASEKESPAHPSVLVDEVLHSIFFLGEIKNEPKYSPKDILVDEDVLNKLKGLYPQPFDKFSTQLPKRAPFSCVLDMVVNLNGQQNEDEIKNRLKEFTLKLKKGEATALVSNTICVSQKNTAQDSVRYYGVSMSTSDRIPGEIIVAASCCKKWDSYVADAVMTYYSRDKKKQKKSYFDGTIKLPEQVRCKAFSLTDGTLMAPCRSCGNMFGLTTSETKEWPYGNCAEAESLSNLLKNENETREQVQQPSDTCTPANRQKAVENVKKLLKEHVNMQQFKRWDGDFYTPQGN
ncbi:uncharacterized protein LOC115578431 [Sparus aurata]|uniref:uncharacterized protein LOC115578431 n=1 Tax=Sparus aurata TaxID=8175 RepID=UPI0011C18378|nr:uncharacterized protein LOC115578431 [Sparus aurata]